MLSTADAVVDRHGHAVAAGHVADLVAHGLDGFERPLQLGKLQLQIGPDLRQPRHPEGQRRGEGERRTAG